MKYRDEISYLHPISKSDPEGVTIVVGQIEMRGGYTWLFGGEGGLSFLSSWRRFDGDHWVPWWRFEIWYSSNIIGGWAFSF